MKDNGEKYKTSKKVRCKCGYIMEMPNVDRIRCIWCERWIFRTPQIEFRYKLRKQMLKEKGL